MDKRILYAAGGVAVLSIAVGAYFFFKPEPPKPEVAVVKEAPPPLPPPPPPAPEPVPEVVEAPPPPPLPPLPSLSKSDSFVFEAMAGLAESPSAMKLFRSKRIIRNMVATIVNLPQQRVPVKRMPVRSPSGKFLTAGTPDDLTISPKNANRYRRYVNIAKAVETKQLVALYIRLYPLFQEAYAELGYPNNRFNDQLNETLDDLLATPALKGSPKLVQPKYFYLYADPAIEAQSVGQKIMLRLGKRNLAIVKHKLSEIKHELAEHKDVFR
ncbi:MAG: DUF3014 domain-containing protein [Gallionellaceae bacterium]